MVRNIFKGLGIALVTPFNEDGSVDYQSLKRLVEYQLDNGADFLCILVTTSETPTLSKEEKAEIKNNQGQPCMVKCAGLDKAQITVGGKAAKVTSMGNGVYSIKSKAGDTVTIVFAS